MLEYGLLALASLVVFVIGGIFAAEMDSAIMSAATFVIGVLTLEYGFELSLWAMVMSNPLWAVGFILLYVAAGAAYTAVWKWPDFIRKNKDNIDETYARWARDLGVNEDNSFDAFLDSGEYRYNAHQHKERLGTWVGMWPFSFVWDVSRRPAIWLWNTLYASLGNMFQAIGRNTARRMHEKE